jgi:ATP-dependent protease HslVU (ClpYQ) peptidase subunit
MTIVAWDGYTLAADKRMNTEGGPGATVRKIAQLSNGSLVGWAGGLAFAQSVIKWLDAGADRELANEAWFEHEDMAVQVIMIAPDKSVWLYEHIDPVPVEDRFYAIGSGAPYAIVAMDLGQTAYQAVQMACKYDAMCGYGIDSLVLEE